MPARADDADRRASLELHELERLVGGGREGLLDEYVISLEDRRSSVLVMQHVRATHDDSIERLALEQLVEILGGERNVVGGLYLAQAIAIDRADPGERHVRVRLENGNVILRRPPAGADHRDTGLAPHLNAAARSCL